jgi:hypothetical protein
MAGGPDNHRELFDTLKEAEDAIKIFCVAGAVLG